MAGLFDIVTNLPKIGSLNGLKNEVKSRATSFVMSSANTLVTEAFNKVTSTLGSSVGGVFGKLTNSGILKSGLGGLANTLGSSNSSLTSVLNSSGISESATSVANMIGANSTEAEYKVILDDNRGNKVIFEAMPDISESRSIEYEPLAPTQMPGEFMKYKGTKATTWVVTAVLTCRTKTEAENNLQYINILRSWCMTFFGDKQANIFDGGTSVVNSLLGAPPPVVMLSGYRTIIGPVPTVITSLSWNWPKDCDWIPTADTKIPFPTVMTVTINLTESFSPDQFNNFDLAAFKSGNMVGAFSYASNANSTSNSASEAEGGSNSGVSGISGVSEAVGKSFNTFAGLDPSKFSVASDVLKQKGVLEKQLDNVSKIQQLAAGQVKVLKIAISKPVGLTQAVILRTQLNEQTAIVARMETRVDEIQQKLQKITGS